MGSRESFSGITTRLFERLATVEEKVDTVVEQTKRTNGSVAEVKADVGNLQLQHARRDGQISVMMWLLCFIIVPLIFMGLRMMLQLVQ